MIAATIQNINGPTDRTNTGFISNETVGTSNSTQDHIKEINKIFAKRVDPPMYGKKRALYFKNKYR